MSKERSKVSIVVPCYNEEEVFPHLKSALSELAVTIEEKNELEIILVDDGSRDDTWQLISDFARELNCVIGLSLSRNFGHQQALTCGYDAATGDAIVCMDADLQDPPEVVLSMIERWREGFDVVHAVRTKREGETRFKLITAKVFYRLIRALGAREVRADVGDFRLMNRAALDALSKLRERHRFIRGMVGWVGFKQTQVEYERKKRRAGVTKYPFIKMLSFAVDATVSFSIVPLRLCFLVALLLNIAVLGYLTYATAMVLIFNVKLVPGWTSLLLSILGFGTCNLISVGIMGEYVGRIYEESKDRPLYLVASTERGD